METLNQRRISDISFIIDKDLKIKDGNRSFLSLMHKTDFDFNLSYILEDSDSKNLKFYLKNFDDNKNQHNFIATIRPQDNYISCIFTISREAEYFKIVIEELSYSRSLLDKALLESREFSALLQNFDTYYFVYDGKRIVLKNTKDLTVLASGSLEAFQEFFPKTFKIVLEHDDTSSQLKAMVSDLQNFESNKYYSFLQTNKKLLTVHTLKTSTRNASLIVGSVQTSNKKDVITNLYNGQKDGLTGLYNKKAITEIAIKKINEEKSPCSLMIIDVDKFKECNDTYGHLFGDRVLVSVANCIQDAIKGAGAAGRIGGDEFLVVLDRTEENDIRNITRNMRTGIQWNITNVEPGSVVTCSIGIARFPLNAKDYNGIFELADKCLYIAKYRGRNCYILYKPEIHDKIIIEKNQMDERVSTGKFFMESANSELSFLNRAEQIDNKNPESVKSLLEDVIKYMNISKISIYDTKNKPMYIAGVDDLDIRSKHLNEKYFSKFNELGMAHFDNTNVLGSTDGKRYDMYRLNEIGSTIELLCNDDSGKYKCFICFDLYKPACTFKNEKVIFAISFAKTLAKYI